MSLDTLPPDQRAVLQLVLQQGRTYEDLAGLLGIAAEAVRVRAHTGAAALGAAVERPSAAEEGDITDFLLGQQTVSQREAIRAHLSSAPVARAWALELADALRPLAGDDLPEIPAGAEEARPAFASEGPRDVDHDPLLAPTPAAPRTRRPARERASRGAPAARARRPEADRGPRSSRLGGAILLGGVVVAVIALIVILSSGGSDKSSNASSTTSGTPTSTTGTSTAQARPEAQVNLRAAQPGSSALAVAQIVRQGTSRAMALVGQKLPASPRGYAVWLFNSPQQAVRLGFTQPVGTNGRLSALAPLPSNANQYKELVVSRETTQSPRTPTTIVLRGPLNLAA